MLSVQRRETPDKRNGVPAFRLHRPTNGTTKILFWNIHDLTVQQVNELKRYFEEFEFLILAETFVKTKKLSRVEIADGGARESMDTVLDTEGTDMIELMEEFGFGVMNGRTSGDWTGQITHVDYRSKFVIDYAACNEQFNNYVTKMKIGDKTQLDHFPIEIELNGLIMLKRKSGYVTIAL